MSNSRGKLYGYYVAIKGELTKRRIKKAKRYVLKQLIKLIKDAAKNEPDFFIIRSVMDSDILSYNTVAAKILLPTLKGSD